MREKSRTFSIKEVSRRHSWTMSRKYSACFGASEMLPRSRLSARSRTAAMGARSSWDTLDTKLVFISARRCCRAKAFRAVTQPSTVLAMAPAMSSPNHFVR